MLEAALVCLVLLALVLFFYLQYRRTPAARWKSNIHVVLALQEARLRYASKEFVAITQATEDKDLHNKLFGRQIESISVEELVRYPNIGPVTVSKLKSAGLTTIPACARTKLALIPGIGPARATDLTAAISQIVREAHSRFEAGASNEGAAYKTALAKRRTEFDQRRQAAEAALHTAEAVLASLRERARIAVGVTFIGYLRRKQPPGLTAEVMNQPLVSGPPALVVPTAPPQPQKPATLPSPSVARESTTIVAAAAAAANPQPRQVEVSPLERMRAVIAFGLAMAKADGRVAAAERKQVRAFVERRYTPTTGKLDGIIGEIEEDVPTLGDAIWQIKRVVPANGWLELYRFAESVADSAGERNTREIEFLARIAEAFRIGVTTAVLPQPTPAVVANTAKAAPTEVECRAALEIAAETPLGAELIRRQYRLLAERFDPEKFTTYGPDFIRLATEKRDLAERAARHLLAGYNEPLEPPTPPPPADLRHNPDLDDVFGV